MRPSPALCSKVGRTALRIPAGVTVAVDARAGRACAAVRGPLGALALPLPPFVRVAVDPRSAARADVRVADPDDRKQRAMWGTTRRLLENLVTGVSEGFTIPVRLVGVGYRAALEPAADNLPLRIVLKLGHSHPIVVPVPSGVEVTIPTPQRLILRGIDLAVVSQLAANIRKHRKPEPYNQKGVFVGDETIKKKEGKKR